MYAKFPIKRIKRSILNEKPDLRN